MEIVDKLSKEQYKQLKNLYENYFKSIHYTEELAKIFAKSKCIDAKRKNRFYKFYYLKDEQDKLVGFIHGKICDNIGLISHIYNSSESQIGYLELYTALANWFKSKGITTLETEINREEQRNSIYSDWELYKVFPDAKIYQKKL